MATVADVTARYENFLLPVLAARDGTCLTCRRPVAGGWRVCYQCSRHRGALPHRADVVAPVALAVEREQWAHELAGYKNSPSPAARSTMARGIAAVLWRWLEAHEECVAKAAGVPEFPVVTSVPSTRGRAQHPLPQILGHIVKPTADRYAQILRVNTRYPPGSRDAAPDRFATERQLHGEAVLLIDDQWTSGGHAQSAACALKLAGAGQVAVVPLGRRLDRSATRADLRQAAEGYYRAAKSQGWSWSTCCLEG